MESNKPQKHTIDKVEVAASRGFNYMTQYTMEHNASRFFENQLFRTKQELIESL